MIVLSLLKNKKGFSMVEMIIVIAIMAILVGGIASYIGYINNGKTKKSIETLKTKLDRVQTDNMAKEGDTYLYLYKTASGIYCKIVNTGECLDPSGKVIYPNGFTNRTEFDNFLASSPQTSELAGSRVDVKAKGVKADGSPADIELKNDNIVKIGFDKTTGAFKCSNNGSNTDFYNVIEFKGSQHYSIKLVKSTGKHIEA